MVYFLIQLTLMIRVVDGSLFLRSSASTVLVTHYLQLYLGLGDTLPTHVKVCTTLSTFKGTLREFLLDQYVVQG